MMVMSIIRSYVTKLTDVRRGGERSEEVRRREVKRGQVRRGEVRRGEEKIV